MISKHDTSLKTLGPQAARLLMVLHERQHSLFTLADVIKITRLKAASARSFIRALVGRGVVSRLQPGLFNLVPFELGREKDYLGNPYVVVRELMGGRDYYISHASAMDIHRMTTQPQLVVQVSSPKLKRPRTIFGTDFHFIHCKLAHFFGFGEQWVTKQDKVLVSDLERTVLDGLKAPRYCGGITETAKGLAMRRSDLDTHKLVDYALRLNVTAVTQRLGYLMEVLDIGTSKDREHLRRHLTAAYASLDPLLPPEGKYLARWRLRLNVSAEEIRALIQT